MEKSRFSAVEDIINNILILLSVRHFLQSPQLVSDGAVCLCKFHRDLTNSLKFNKQSILQRGGILGLFWRQMPQNTAVENLQERLSSRSFCVLCDAIDI